MKNIGSKAESLFEKKKKEVSEEVDEKKQEAAGLVNEQIKKTGEALQKTKEDATKIASETGR